MKRSILTIMALMGLSSCLDKADFSEIPAIKFENARINPSDNSISLKVSFTDGDGDIGLQQNEEFDPYDPCGPYYYNLFVDPYYLDDGNFRIGRKVADTNCKNDTNIKIGYYYRMPYIVPEGKEKSLEGDIDVVLNSILVDYPDDTIKLRIWIYDRALHKSNVVESGLIITP